MCLIVHGFPSKLAALQFEWAWQHTGVTRHVKEMGLEDGMGGIRNQGNGKGNANLNKKIADLYALLQSKSFRRWPLGVRFFAKDIHQTWTLWSERSAQQLRPEIVITLDTLASEGPQKKLREKVPAQSEMIGPLENKTSDDSTSTYPIPPTLTTLDAGYGSIKYHLEKSTSVISTDQAVSCGICQQSITSAQHLKVICPHDGCNSMSHLTCMSAHFRQTNHEGSEILPTSGSCPSCKRTLTWIQLVKELSVRARNPALTSKILKPPRKAKGVITNEDEDEMEDENQESENDFAYKELMAAESQLQEEIRIANPETPDDDFIPIDDYTEDASDGDDLPVPPSGQIPNSMWSQASPSKHITEIPDSEWGHVEIVA
jgi:structure-specific endonuclease subunit SLX1